MISIENIFDNSFFMSLWNGDILRDKYKIIELINQLDLKLNRFSYVTVIDKNNVLQKRKGKAYTIIDIFTSTKLLSQLVLESTNDNIDIRSWITFSARFDTNYTITLDINWRKKDKPSYSFRIFDWRSCKNIFKVNETYSIDELNAKLGDFLNN